MPRWKNLDDIKIQCKKCNEIMIVESIRYNGSETNGMFYCRKCGDHVNLKSLGKYEGRSDWRK